MNQGWGWIAAVLTIPPIFFVFRLVFNQLELFGRFALIRAHRARAYLIALIDSVAAALVAMAFAELWPALLTQILGPDTTPAGSAQHWASELARAVLHGASLFLTALAGATALSIAVLGIWRAIRGVPDSPEQLSVHSVHPIGVARHRNQPPEDH